MITTILVLLSWTVQAQNLDADLAAATADLSHVEKSLEFTISDPNANPCDATVLKINREYSDWFVRNQKNISEIVLHIQAQYQEARTSLLRHQDLQFQLTAQKGQTSAQAQGSLIKAIAFIKDANKRLNSQKNLEMKKVVRKQLEDFSMSVTKINIQQVKKIIELYNLELARYPNSKGNVSEITLEESDILALSFSVYFDFDSFNGVVEFKDQRFAPGFQLKTNIRFDNGLEEQIDVRRLAYSSRISLLKTPLTASLRFADLLYKNMPPNVCGSYRQKIVPLNSVDFYVRLSGFESAEDASVLSHAQTNIAMEKHGYQQFKILDDQGEYRTIYFSKSGVQVSGDVNASNNDYDRKRWLAHCLKVRMLSDQDQVYAEFSPNSHAWQCRRNPYADFPSGSFKVEGIGTDRVYVVIPNGVGTLEYKVSKGLLIVSFFSSEHRKPCNNPEHVFFSYPMVVGKSVLME